MWAGLWAGLGAAMKATPLLFVGLFGLRMHWLALLMVAVGAFGATLMPDLIWPRADGEAWWRAWYDVNLKGMDVGAAAEAGGAWNAHSVLNQSLGGAMRRLFTPVEVPGVFVVGGEGEVLLLELSPRVAYVATLAMSALVLGLLSLCVLYARRAVRAAGDAGAAAQRRVALGEIGAFACGMLLLSPQSSKSHFCVWLFPVAFVVNRLVRGRRDVATLLLFVAAFVLGMLSKGVLGREMANLVLGYGSVAWSSFLLLLACLRCLQIDGRD